MNQGLALLENGLLDYPSLQPEHVQTTFQSLHDQNVAALQQIIANHGQAPGWDTFVLAIEQLDQRLEDLFHSLVPLNYESDEWAVAIDACYQLLLDWARCKHENPGLYEGYLRIDAAGLDEAHRTVLKLIIRGFRYAGHGLATSQMAQLQATDRAIAGLEQQFLNNLIDARNAWSLEVCDASRLAGLPLPVRERLALNAKEQGGTGWLVDLNESTVEEILAWSDVRELRETVYLASRRLASDLGGNSDLDNAPVLQALLRLRHERAQLLGCGNAAELGLEVKDARNVTQVESFINDLIEFNRPRLREDLRSLQVMGKTLGIDEVAPWDVPYLNRKLRMQGIEELEANMRDYFTMDAALQGLWQLHERLFGITIAASAAPGWHADVQVLSVSEGGTLIGHIYLDAYERPGKLPWPYSYPMCQRHTHADGTVTLPTALLSCSFKRTPGQASCTLSHEDLCKLFHEAGHAVHQLLVTNHHRRLNRVATSDLGPDSCEFVGILLEQWCWSAPALLALHQPAECADAVTLPEMQQWLDRLRCQQAVKEAEKLRRCWFDFMAHVDGHAGRNLRQFAIDASRHVGLPESFEEERFVEAFDYLVTGYEAGFYCYKWAQVHAVDAFRAVTASGAPESSIGRRMRQEILSKGGLRRLTASFQAFVGRPLSLDAYTRWHLSA
ncbi:M3 family metallopeptidase [Pseudomonas sp. NPDC089996]|uniref:M3 family metallopeptidase n=1 Tax=Pseudomonas sp. NPDC089996 TaxID=3364474 RepID=UPI00381FA547